MKRSLLAATYFGLLLVLGVLALSGCGESSIGGPLPPTPTTAPTELPGSGLPSDIPIYPGAQPVNLPTSQAGQASFQVTATPEMVSSFYQQQMPQQGWKKTQLNDNGADGVILAFRKDTRVAHIVISPGFNAGQVVILITVGSN
jgi:hypothetical protein